MRVLRGTPLRVASFLRPLASQRGGMVALPLGVQGKNLLLDVQGENTHPSPLMLKGELKGV